VVNRKTWKIYYRALRVARREANKASADMISFGTGIVCINNGEAKHVPIADYMGIDEDNCIVVKNTQTESNKPLMPDLSTLQERNENW